jgi:hypothetical protein
MKKSLGLFLCALALSACSSLEVKVSIADPSVARNVLDQLNMRNDLPRVRAESSVEIDRVLTELTRKHRQIWQKFQEGYRAQAKAATTDEERDFFTALAASFDDDVFNEDVARVYQSRKGVLSAIAEAVREHCPTSGGCPPAAIDRVTALLRERREHLSSLERLREDDLQRGLRNMHNPSVRAEVIALSVAADEDTRSLIGRSGLQTSPEAYAVITSKAWTEKFDFSRALGRLGDLNVAIKMERRGNFTIKGVSFDPSEVARAISKMGTQLVLAIAQTSGVPVRTAAGTTPAAGLPTSSEALGAAIATVETAAADQDNRREALLAIAIAIAREKANIDDTEAKRKAAIKAIDATFKAHKTRIGATAPAS